ncbi:M28 family metallopeptidase [Telmatobacter bradus]|uniref:M28 family metallopeptidase n=1 Tax=Telmatobacter bradus TaxID=474953 RepID=UPI003B433648
MFARAAIVLLLPLTLAVAHPNPQSPSAPSVPPAASFGYVDFAAESRLEEKFLSVPDAKLAGEHLKTLTAAPHMAATPEDRRTAEYVARKFRTAGLDTEIVPYRVLLNQPIAERLEAWDASGRLLMTGPTREHVEGDHGQDDPRVVMPFSGASASGDVLGEVVYANYGRPEDFRQLEAEHIDLHGKIVLCRYGMNFRGVKVFLAEQRGAAAVLIYSDPADDGANRGEVWPKGPWRPSTGVQRGSVQYIFRSPGDPETPGVASTPSLPDSARLRHFTGPKGVQPAIPALPISAHDAQPILASLKGAMAPREWQGGLDLRYRLTGGVRVHLLSRQNYQRRIIWDVIGRVRGTAQPDEWIVAGNHRDAWVYGAVDPSSGTAAMLETVHGLGTLLRQGWRPRRSLLICSWDAEEEGLIGSTEWVEQHPQILRNTVAYFNMDVAVAGPDFSAAATPSLKEFLRGVTRSVPSPQGGSVFQQWRSQQAGLAHKDERHRDAQPEEEVRIAGLGSGSDFTPFFERAGVPSADLSSEGSYGVYHSAFDSYDWYVRNADPHFAYLQQMARVFGLAVLRMDGAEVLPYDDAAYASEIAEALENARTRAGEVGLKSLDFAPALSACSHFQAAARSTESLTLRPPTGLARQHQLNQALRQAESDLLSPAGLPGRPWYKHLIFAPGGTTGYAAVILPGVNEAIDAEDKATAATQLTALSQALERAAQTLNAVR